LRSGARMPAKSREAVLAQGRSLLVLLSLVCAFGTTSPAQAQSQASVREFRATRTTRPPTIDGQLNEEVWSQAQVMSDFTQIDPDEGQPATERTEVRVLYDDHALYVGVRLFDHDTVHLGRRLSTRDGDGDADRVTLYLDTMHDHLTGVMFRVSASNVQTDAVLFNDTWDDWSWNAVWESNVSIDDDGWSVELRLPLSQLRFTSDDKQTWGINVERYIRRRNEGSWLEMVPKKETGRASRMVHLTGLDGLKPSRRLELLPYTAGRAEYVAPASTVNPFNDGSRVFASAGLDMKYGLTSNLTVDATVNPDFGQVEVDPAVVNLSAFETFFEEKRAFFLEGAQNFNNFGRGGSNGNWGFNNSEPQIFYSRRIGRSPQLQPEAEFADPPTATTILGAAKLTGKTSRGWSIGLLEAITSTEKAPTETAFVRGEAVVEPMTNYAVVRLQRDIGRRAGVGMLATAVNRRINTPIVNATLPDNAYVAGADGYLFLDADRDWAMNFAASGSRVDGSTSAITRLQLAPQRYYQRPDALHLHLDPNATSLSGFSGRVSLNRNSGLVQINTMLWGVSPGFESNDLGFHSNGDRAGAHGVLIWRNVTPGQWLRDRTIWVAKAYTWNFARELQSDVIGSQGRFTFVNYWNAGAAIFANRHAPDDRLTRGGPMAMSPRGFDLNGWVNTDDRKRLSLNINAGISDNAAGGWGRSLGVTFNIKPSDRFTLSTGPDWNRSYGYAQYVRSVDDPTATSTFGGRYVFGGIDQWQLTMTTRANVIFSPHASLQVYMQPLLATGDYSGFKELAQPRTHDFLRYGTDIGSLSFEPGTRMYTADPDGAGVASPFTFEDPDYNFKSLRLNAVFRWEMKPGSNFYVVWTRQQQDLTNPGHFAPARDARAMFTAPGDDIILFKLSYWLGR
jgi:hypothetical protein